MRTDSTIKLEVQSSITQYLYVGEDTWIIFKGHVLAVANQDAVTFPDIEHSRAAMKLINEHRRFVPHIRVRPEDFDYTVASSGMRALRPLLGRPSQAEENRGEPS